MLCTMYYAPYVCETAKAAITNFDIILKRETHTQKQNSYAIIKARKVGCLCYFVSMYKRNILHMTESSDGSGHCTKQFEFTLRDKVINFFPG